MGKHKHSKKHKSKSSKKEKKRTSSSSNSEDEWVERVETNPSDNQIAKTQNTNVRDEWFSLPTTFTSSTNTERRKERDDKKQIEKIKSTYNPRENVRELNPYWKNNGDGLPTFKKPSDDNIAKASTQKALGRWKKNDSKPIAENIYTNIYSKDEDEPNQKLTDKELNVLAAKLVKAEIMGNTALVEELKEKLDKARMQQSSSSNLHTSNQDREEVILSRTDSKGFSKPFKQQHDRTESNSSGSSRKKQKVETHTSGERVRYFADDDKYSLKQMFENEKFNSVEEQNMQFIKLAGKVRKNDDLDDIFTDNIRQGQSSEKIDKANRDKAINEHRRITESLEQCRRCIESEKMLKNLIITTGETMYIALPDFEPLTNGHCLISSIRHVSCVTQLDENEWADLLDFRKTLTALFVSQDRDVIFFENAKNINRHPHMYIECIPVDKETGDMAPIYFKKAIDESDIEWSDNKKLVSLAGRDVRRAIPKGLPYFSVSFGMQEGYAHVIEDKQYFSDNFAQEIIGGMLDLPHNLWRKPKVQNFQEQSKRVLQFTKMWKEFNAKT